MSDKIIPSALRWTASSWACDRFEIITLNWPAPPNGNLHQAAVVHRV